MSVALSSLSHAPNVHELELNSRTKRKGFFFLVTNIILLRGILEFDDPFREYTTKWGIGIDVQVGKEERG
jgi:hypothetical protein